MRRQTPYIPAFLLAGSLRQYPAPARCVLCNAIFGPLLLEGKRYALERAIFEVGQCFGESAVISSAVE